MSKLVLCASAVLLLFAALPAKAQDIEVLRAYHIACDHGDHGDRAACVRFGIMLGENKGRREEWRRLRSIPDIHLKINRNFWCRQRGLNPRPSVYKTAALPLSYAGAARWIA